MRRPARPPETTTVMPAKCIWGWRSMRYRATAAANGCCQPRYTTMAQGSFSLAQRRRPPWLDDGSESELHYRAVVGASVRGRGYLIGGGKSNEKRCNGCVARHR